MTKRATRILILGGTKDARLLAEMCVNEPGHEPGHERGPDTEVITSLAGRTKSPQAIAGTVRVGGFGGAAGLMRYLRHENISMLVDATHPFADTISGNAAKACLSKRGPSVRQSTTHRGRREPPKSVE